MDGRLEDSKRQDSASASARPRKSRDRRDSAIKISWRHGFDASMNPLVLAQVRSGGDGKRVI